MKICILLPHFKTGRMSAFTIAQLLKYRGEHEMKIIVIDNNSGDGSIEYLRPFENEITIINYPKIKQQSHGASFDFVLESGVVDSDYFIPIESDCYPTKENWISYYEELINRNYDIAGSIMDLSGGQYIHPAASLYSKKLWQEAKNYCDNIEYSYFPNMSSKEGFDGHLMVHKRVLEQFLEQPEDFIELGKSYQPYSKEAALHRREYYSSIVAPFHNGMGTKQESVKTFGRRTIESEKNFTLLDNKMPLIFRVGAEPGQWLSYYAAATNKKMGAVPTKIKWLPNRQNQQQEYTINEAGMKHEWGITAWNDADSKEHQDIIQYKKNKLDELYNSLPPEYKISE